MLTTLQFTGYCVVDILVHYTETKYASVVDIMLKYSTPTEAWTALSCRLYILNSDLKFQQKSYQTHSFQRPGPRS